MDSDRYIIIIVKNFLFADMTWFVNFYGKFSSVEVTFFIHEYNVHNPILDPHSWQIVVAAILWTEFESCCYYVDCWPPVIESKHFLVVPINSKKQYFLSRTIAPKDFVFPPFSYKTKIMLEPWITWKNIFPWVKYIVWRKFVFIYSLEETCWCWNILI